MALDPHMKQQIRSQVETGLEEVYHVQNDAMKMISDVAHEMMVRQYQRLNRVESKRKERKAKRQKFLGRIQTAADRSLDRLSEFTPIPGTLIPFRFLVGVPFRGIEFLELQIDTQIYYRLNKTLTKNTELVDHIIEKLTKKLDEYQLSWKTKVKEELALRFPLSDEEHLALARDITELVRRVELPAEQSYF